MISLAETRTGSGIETKSEVARTIYHLLSPRLREINKYILTIRIAAFHCKILHFLIKKSATSQLNVQKGYVIGRTH